MKYLINKLTKTHRVYEPRHVLFDDTIWTLVEADSEGWIAHTGNECPLPDDVLCEYRMPGGVTSKQKWLSRVLRWTKTNSDADITHYKPILEQAEKAKEPESHPTEFQKSCTEALQKRFYPETAEPKPSLLDRLKAAHEAAQTIPDLEAELREVLAGMGYDLVSRSPFAEPEISKRVGEYHIEFNSLCAQVRDPQAAAIAEPEAASETPQDLSDWRNWREGDSLMCWQRGVFGLFEGALVTVQSIDEYGNIFIGGSTHAYRSSVFRFHSRPKGE
jgi:hypothetical protein